MSYDSDEEFRAPTRSRVPSISHSINFNGESNGLYSIGHNQSQTSVYEGVEMAQDTVFSGPIAESLPSSISAFHHDHFRRRSCSFAAYSNADQAYDEEAIDDYIYPDQYPGLPVDDILEGLESSIPQALDGAYDVSDNSGSASVVDPQEEGGFVMTRRRSSTFSRRSVHDRLLGRTSISSGRAHLHRLNYRASTSLPYDDLNVDIVGYVTTPFRTAVYVCLCLFTLGFGWLYMRWKPEKKASVLGEQTAFAKCDWVLVKDQYDNYSIVKLRKREYQRPFSTVFGSRPKLGWQNDDAHDPMLEELIEFEYRYLIFAYHSMLDTFVLLSGWKDPNWTSIEAVRIGITVDEYASRKGVFGPNSIDVAEPPTSQLLVKEILHPFYIFQIASLVLWSMDEYYYYACAILFMSIGSIWNELAETKKTMRRLCEVSKFDCNVRITRSGFWRTVKSSDLVPGDVYEVDSRLPLIPCDSLLLTGNCLVNESMLTGEAIPINKTPATDATLAALNLSAPSVSNEVNKHFLYNGTKLVRATQPNGSRDESCLALVVRTGFSTTKGNLVRSMLFPKPAGFNFHNDSLKYVSVMSIIAAIGFMVSLVNFIRLGLRWKFIVIRALDLITIVVPPALPATLSIGTTFAIKRLKKDKIFCISPQRINVAGKIDIMCFDKTGTLTVEGLEVLGIRPVTAARENFEDIKETSEDLSTLCLDERQTQINHALLYSMATCHALKDVDNELVGDPLDVKMFEFTGWTFDEKPETISNEADIDHGVRPAMARAPPTFAALSHVPVNLGIQRSFDFVSELRRASVVVRQLNDPSVDVYVKGAPEVMPDICRSESFPPNFEGLLSQYTHAGFRVIAVATKHFQKLSWNKVRKMSREAVESDLEFLGFILFENRLKDSTTEVLKQLHDSNIGTIMITGDNILTAISVARSCALIDPMAHCFIPKFLEGHREDPKAVIRWESINTPGFYLDSRTLIPDVVNMPPDGPDLSVPDEMQRVRNFTLAVSGEMFRWIIEHGSAELVERMLIRGLVFARMSPDEKCELVEKLREIGYTTGFCGDGANDCAALKAADVGISLSEAEASVAAPFTSQIFEISCILTVMREGRASLVTSFACFKYMSLYSAIQFCTVSFLYAKASNLGDFQFLFIDLALIIPIAIFMSWGGPHKRLGHKKPTANLVSRKVLVPLMGQIIIIIAFQAFVYVLVHHQPWYIPPKVHHKRPDILNSENTSLFLVSCFQYIFIGVVLNSGPPFRAPTYKNWPFLLTISTATIIAVYMTIYPAGFVKNLMELTYMSWWFRVFIIALGPAYLGTAWFSEVYFFGWLSKGVGKTLTKITGKEKEKKRYKAIEESMRF